MANALLDECTENLKRSCNLLWHFPRGEYDYGNSKLIIMIKYLIQKQIEDDCDYNSYLITLVRLLRIYAPDLAKNCSF